MKRFEVWLARLDPTEGAEMRKSRPVVIVSPDVMNERLHTVIGAPLTTGGFDAPFRIPCRFAGTEGQVALDHLRALSKTRLRKRLGVLETAVCDTLCERFQEMFGK